MVVRNDIDNTSAIISIKLTKEDLQPKIDAELKRFRQKAPIKGFRQGQAPIEFVKKMFGASIFSDTLQNMLNTELMDYLKENKIQVLGQPLPTEDQKPISMKINNLDPEYQVDYEIGFVPDFELKGIDKTYSYERLTVSNLDELAEKDLEYARKRMGQRSNPENDIQEEDILRIASRELEGDKIKEGGWETTITVLVSKINNPELKTQVLFLKKGDTLRFNARDLESAEKDNFYRKYILNLPENDDRVVGDMFEGVIEEVSRVTDAELNEAFYKDYFGGTEVNSKEDAIETLKKGILQFYDGRSDALLMRTFQEKLMEINNFELPVKFISRWLKATNEGRLTEAQVERETPAFLTSLRWSLLSDRIKEALDVFVTNEDIQEHFADRIASYFQGQVDRAFCMQMAERMMNDKKEVEKVERDIEYEKMAQAIKSQVSLVDKAVTSEEFHKILDEITQKAKVEQSEGESLTENFS